MSDNLREIKQRNHDDIMSALNNIAAEVDQLDGVIILALKKDGGQRMETSTMSGFQKAFLCQFLNAWMTKWFRIGETDAE